MANVDMKRIEKLADDYGRDLDRVNKRLRTLSSAKTRLNGKKGLSDYEFRLSKILAEMEAMRQVKHLLSGHSKVKKVTEYEQADVDILTYDETMRAIESIRSKKSLTRWITEIDGDNDAYRDACRIETMLLEHKKTVKPIDGNTVAKSSIKALLDLIAMTEDISIDTVVSELKGMLED